LIAKLETMVVEFAIFTKDRLGFKKAQIARPHQIDKIIGITKEDNLTIILFVNLIIKMRV